MVEPDEGFIDHPTPKPKHFIKEIMNMTTLEDDTAKKIADFYKIKLENRLNCN